MGCLKDSDLYFCLLRSTHADSPGYEKINVLILRAYPFNLIMDNSFMKAMP
jgi:hypothetical protein